MKTLMLVRHAKSDWSHEGLSDRERPLNDRGHRDAPEMAKRLRKKGVKTDVLVSSDAKRALRTARYFAEEWSIDKDDIRVEESLYGAGVETFAEVVASLRDKEESVALFSHNPGITEFANTLCQVRIDNMPTCSVFAVQADVKSWSEFAAAEKQFLFFDYPKNPLNNV